jgi:hypothetical protein
MAQTGSRSGYPVFTARAAFLDHACGTMQGESGCMAMNTFLDHFGLILGLVIAALIAEHANIGERY